MRITILRLLTTDDTDDKDDTDLKICFFRVTRGKTNICE